MGVFVAALLLSGFPARAFEQCPEPQFGIEAIAIDRVETTAEEAQTLGIRQAAQVGFQRVLLRLLRDSAAVSTSWLITILINLLISIIFLKKTASRGGTSPFWIIVSRRRASDRLFVPPA